MRKKDLSSNEPLNCPHCGVSLLGEKIPDNIANNYPGTHWKREIGIEVPEGYDGVYYFKCPDCEGEWGGAGELRKSKKI